MGKCGAQELNYISDVDVVFVAEPADAKATRWAGEFVNIGTRVFFEVDAALRPEGKQGALVRTLDSHLTYYDRWAHTWEFQALLKARPMTGDLELGEKYIAGIAPKVWAASEREDFVPDVQAMRRRVIENVPEEIRNRELKLGGDCEMWNLPYSCCRWCMGVPMNPAGAIHCAIAARANRRGLCGARRWCQSD